MRSTKGAVNLLRTGFFLFAAAIGLNGCNDVSTAPPPPTPLSPDAKLSTLTVSPGTLAPAFSSDTINYSVDVVTATTSVTVTASPQNTSATMTINGVSTAAGQGRTVSLGVPGSITNIPIVVTAPNQTQNTYVVSVTRLASSDNNLSALSVTGQTLNPVFSPTTTSYTVNVASTVINVQVSATKAELNATMSGAITAVPGVATGQATITLLGPGSTTPISITVTAPNGSSKIYTINVNRAALGGNNFLQSLTVSSGTLSPAFNASITSYSDNVASGVGSLTVTAQPQDAGATVSINGQAGTSRSITLNAAGQSTLVTIVVTAPNLTTNTYTVLVNRAAALSNNNNLSNLVVSAGALSPPFAQGTLTYSVSTPNATSTTTVSATLADSTASMTINGVPATSGVPFGPINLIVGPNTITIVVTAQNSSLNTYTVVVTRLP